MLFNNIKPKHTVLSRSNDGSIDRSNYINNVIISFVRHKIIVFLDNKRKEKHNCVSHTRS